MGRIGDDAIRDIRERASLVELIGDSVALRRRGGGYTGLCPFHAEKTPSFSVSEERKFFHCFGCGEHGDAFSFIMKTEGLSFPEAVRRVAARFGLPVPEDDGGARSPSEPLLAACARAAQFFREQLRAAAGAAAREYLASRGLRPETIERFALGYAPGSGEALARHLRSHGIAENDAVTAGLVLRRNNGPGTFDRFRDRVMFPIADASGRVIAFGGRIMPQARSVAGDPPPKYLNSPETPIFHKGQTVYGLALARNAIRTRGRVLVVEGYVDVISLAEAGIEEAVAPLGTALTAEQLKVIGRQSEKIIACFDGDAAGRRAAARSFATFIEAGLWGLAIFLPDGEDPDSFVRRRGVTAIEDLLKHAEPLIEAFIGSIEGSGKEAVGRRAEAAAEVARLLKRVPELYRFNGLVALAAERLRVPEGLLRADGAPAPATPAAVSAGTVSRATRPAAKVVAAGAEELLVELMAVDAATVDAVRDAAVLEAFADRQCRDLAHAFLEARDADARAALIAELPRALRDRVAHRLLGEGVDEDRSKAVDDCIARIKQRRQRPEHDLLREHIRAASARGENIEADLAVIQRLLSEKSLR